MTNAELITKIFEELAKATEKFPLWPDDALHALAIVGEEFGEMTKDALQLAYEPHKTTRDNLRKESYQTAAMALRFAMSLEEYEHNPSVQHSQGAIPVPYFPDPPCNVDNVNAS